MPKCIVPHIQFVTKLPLLAHLYCTELKHGPINGHMDVMQCSTPVVNFKTHLKTDLWLEYICHVMDAHRSLVIMQDAKESWEVMAE